MKVNYPRILAIEAATRTQSIALIANNDVLEHRQQTVRFDHGSVLLQNIDDIMTSQRLKVQDIDLFAIGIGPGSFTSLRVSLAAAKALARAINKPIIGVSSLASLAYPQLAVHPDSIVCAMLDARRSEVYAGFYRLAPNETDDGHIVCIEDECAADPQSLSELIKKHATPTKPVIIAGTAHLAFPKIDLWQQDFLTILPAWTQQPGAIATAFIGRQQASQQFATNPQTIQDLATLEPNYIRAADAKIPANAPWLKASQ